MKDYLSIEKGISEIIQKLNKLKKTAKDVCINISVKKRGKTKRKTRSNKLASKGNQYSNVYKSPNVSFNLEPNKTNNNKTNNNKTNNNKRNKTNKNKTNESIESVESEPVESPPVESTESSGSNPLMSMFESETKQ
jgi:hypothetical protein